MHFLYRELRDAWKTTGKHAERAFLRLNQCYKSIFELRKKRKKSFIAENEETSTFYFEPPRRETECTSLCRYIIIIYSSYYYNIYQTWSV